MVKNEDDHSFARRDRPSCAANVNERPGHFGGGMGYFGWSTIGRTARMRLPSCGHQEPRPRHPVRVMDVNLTQTSVFRRIWICHVLTLDVQTL